MTSNRSQQLARALICLSRDTSPDDVYAHYSRIKPRLKLKVLPPDEADQGPPTLLIEGDETALLFLADLLVAQAGDVSDCGTQLLTVEGSAFFHQDSELGLYVHALPCKGPCEAETRPEGSGPASDTHNPPIAT